VVGCAVADLLVVMLVVLRVVRRGECRCDEYEQASEEEKLLHGDQNGTKVDRLSLVFC
jgi:hypothetical protein